MENDWILFYHNGKVKIDMSLGTFQDVMYPYSDYHVTPHYGKVYFSSVLQLRPAKEEA